MGAYQGKDLYLMLAGLCADLAEVASFVFQLLLAEGTKIENGQQLFAGAVKGGQEFIQLFEPVVMCFFKIGQEEVCLGFEMVIQRAAGNGSLIDDLVDTGEVIALVIE